LVVTPTLENRLEDKDDDVIFEDLCLFAVYGEVFQEYKFLN
jgi:hypothetical protein